MLHVVSKTNVSFSIYLINMYNGLSNFQVIHNYKMYMQHRARCNQFAPFSLHFKPNSLVSVFVLIIQSSLMLNRKISWQEEVWHYQSGMKIKAWLNYLERNPSIKFFQEKDKSCMWQENWDAEIWTWKCLSEIYSYKVPWTKFIHDLSRPTKYCKIIFNVLHSTSVPGFDCIWGCHIQYKVANNK